MACAGILDRGVALTLFASELGTGPQTIVLLHGFGAIHGVWSAIQEELAADARTLAYDLPGHGRSLSHPGPGSAKAAAQAVLADLAARGVDAVHVVGHSMGGAVAVLMAMFSPDRIASLTLLAPGGFGPEINHRLLTRYAAAVERAEIESSLEAMFGWMSPVPAEAIEREAAARAVEGQSARLREIAAGLARDGRQGELPADALAALAMPVAVVWGELDNVLPARHARTLPGSFARHVFADLGHMLPEEAPQAMAGIVRRTAGLPVLR